MRLSVERNPWAMRVISRSLVLTLSVSPLDRPCVTVAMIPARWSLDAVVELDEGGSPARAGPR